MSDQSAADIERLAQATAMPRESRGGEGEKGDIGSMSADRVRQPGSEPEDGDEGVLHRISELRRRADALVEADSRDSRAEVEKALADLDSCDRALRASSLLSDNEGLEDISTPRLQCLLVDPLRAQLHQLVQGAGRERHLVAASALGARFLDTCVRLGLTSEQELKDATASLGVPVDREQKIARFRREREARNRVQAFEARRREAKVRGADPDAAVDEEDERAHMRALLDLAVLRCLDDARAIRQELDILAHMRAMEQARGGEEGGAREGEKGSGDERAPTRGGDGASATAGAAPEPRAAGRGGMEVTHVLPGGVTRREVVRANVFRPGHNLPTMSLEEFAEQEVQEAMAREERAQNAPKPDRRMQQLEEEGLEDDAELVDRAAYRDREWDDWKDDHPKGSGVTKKF